MSNLIDQLPPMLSGEELRAAMASLPEYDENIVYASAPERLVALTDLYRVFVPSEMSIEIYSKLYLALLRSLQKKQGVLRVQQGVENHRATLQSYNGVIGGADSLTIIGASGIGKSSAIAQSVQLITTGKIITVDKPYSQILPCVLVQCPFDSSVKGLLLEILRVVDEKLGSSYYPKVSSNRATTDMLIGTVSQVALNHIGILIVDEIQNIAISRNGRNLFGALLQLINCSGISIVMVGTPECSDFFTQAFQLARRSLGIEYSGLPFGEEFHLLIETLFKYQFVRSPGVPTDSMMRWIYEHSGGNVSSVVTLIHDAQELAILDGSEELTVRQLENAYSERMKMLHSFISAKKLPQTTKKKQTKLTLPPETDATGISISELISQAKAKNIDIAEYLSDFLPVEVVDI